MDGLGLGLEKILPIFERDPRILALYLLGSAHSGRMRKDSDVDLAVMPEPGVELSGVERSDLAAQAALELGRDVDLGEASTRNLVYAREAILNGRRLFARDLVRTELREATLLGLYARFHDERREVADAYRIG